MEKDVDRIPKNAETDIVIRVDDFGGKRGLTIREFVKGERYTGFTKAGTRIPAEHFKAFKEAINSINEGEMMQPVEEAGMEGSQAESSPGGNEEMTSSGQNESGSDSGEDIEESTM